MTFSHTHSRIQKRTRTSLPAKFREAGAFSWRQGDVVNVSRGGLCLFTRESVSLEDPLEIEILTVDREGQKQKRRVAGQVVWKRGHRYGVRFTGGDPRRAKPIIGKKKKLSVL